MFFCAKGVVLCNKFCLFLPYSCLISVLPLILIFSALLQPYFCLIPALFLPYSCLISVLPLILLISAILQPYSCLISGYWLLFFFLQKSDPATFFPIPALFLPYLWLFLSERGTLQLILLIPTLFLAYSCLISALFLPYSCLISALFLPYFCFATNSAYICLITALFLPYFCLISVYCFFGKNPTPQHFFPIPALFLPYLIFFFGERGTLQQILPIPALFLPHFWFATNSAYFCFITALFLPYSCLISALFLPYFCFATNSAYFCLITALFLPYFLLFVFLLQKSDPATCFPIPALFLPYLWLFFSESGTLQLILLIPTLFLPYSYLISVLPLILLIFALLQPYFCLNPALFLPYSCLISALFLPYFWNGKFFLLQTFCQATFFPYSCLIYGFFERKGYSATNSAYSYLIPALFLAICFVFAEIIPRNIFSYSCHIPALFMLFFAKGCSATNSALFLPYFCFAINSIYFCLIPALFLFCH